MHYTTLSDFLNDHQTAVGFDNQLKSLILELTTACHKISDLVRQGELGGAIGSLENTNVQGEVQQKLDVLSNNILLEHLEKTGLVAAMASEEMDTFYPIPESLPKGEYLVLFDPLDGSSNIDVNVSIGTIFSILKAPQDAKNRALNETDFLQPGKDQIAAGYVIYGPQTILMLTLGQGVFAFTLNPNTQTWQLSQSNITIPEETKEFAINMSNYRHWAPAVRTYIDDCLAGETGPRQKNFNMRWIASMVADVHRILTRGGLFMYPWDQREPQKAGKLRLMYEANPMSLLIEQAGGLSSNCTEAILSLKPQELHQRVSVCLGSKNEVEIVQRHHL